MRPTILTFENIRQVIKADQLLKQQGIWAKIIPVPEQISSECGMCIETDDEKLPDIKGILNDFRVQIWHLSK